MIAFPTLGHKTDVFHYILPDNIAKSGIYNHQHGCKTVSEAESVYELSKTAGAGADESGYDVIKELTKRYIAIVVDKIRQFRNDN